MQHIQHAQLFGQMVQIASHIPEWNAEEFKISEASIIEGMEFYQHATCGPRLKSQLAVDCVMMGTAITPLALLFGNLEGTDAAHQKLLMSWEETGIAETRDYVSDSVELFWYTVNMVPLLLILGRESQAFAALKAVGFTWKTIEAVDTLGDAIEAKVPTKKKDATSCYSRLAIFLASPEGEIDEDEFNAWIPSPTKLAKFQNGDPILALQSLNDTIYFGAQCFLKLGRDDEAYEAAKIAVSKEQNTRKKSTRIMSYIVLGRIAAKRSDIDEAEGFFSEAMVEAKLSRLPMFEVLVARDWKKYLLDPNGRDASAAEAAIDAACAKMKKSRGDLASVLLG